ncbi:MAG: sel1 repeat family protein, partial [Proteobacteria bacterium]|nr:sel1 repeat family protein [Pseudomonadota bacterium]
GWFYAKGLGVPQDYKQAVKWYRKATEQGFDGAQFKLGTMYLRGHGVPQGYVMAHKWFNLAAAKRNVVASLAREGRDAIAKKMTPAQIAEAQRLAREWKPKK